MKEYNCSNTPVKIGENASENWELVDNAKPEYWWVHLTSFPSPHIIIETDEPSIGIIERCASLCKLKTKYKNMKNLRVDYTPISNLIKGDKVGEVIYISRRKVKNIKI